MTTGTTHCSAREYEQARSQRPIARRATPKGGDTLRTSVDVVENELLSIEDLGDTDSLSLRRYLDYPRPYKL